MSASGGVRVRETPERIDAECSVCFMGVDVPNKGLGRAVVAAFKTQHQHGQKN